MHNKGITPKGSQEDIVKALFSKEAITTTAKYVEIMYNSRKELLFYKAMDENDNS